MPAEAALLLGPPAGPADDQRLLRVASQPLTRRPHVVLMWGVALLQQRRRVMPSGTTPLIESGRQTTAGCRMAWRLVLVLRQEARGGPAARGAEFSPQAGCRCWDILGIRS